MNTYFMIVNGVVVNSCVADEAFMQQWKASTPNSNYVLSDNLYSVSIGWKYDGTNFTSV